MTTELKNFTEDEIEKCKEIASGERDILDDERLWEKLYVNFQLEMPYGVQKARTGDPMDWIVERLETVFGGQDVTTL
jgi:hypothetical protein